MQEEYIRRINKVLTFIEENLDAELSLHTVSDIACYSPYHLHRLFKAVTNETLNSYITRKRIEKTALMLMHRKEFSIAEIAGKHGFKDDSTFSRTFKKLYGQSPSGFRKSRLNTISKIDQENSKIGQVNVMTEEYICNVNNLKDWMNTNAQIEITEMPKMNLAYITHIGLDGLESSFQRIFKWATPKGILAQTGTYLCRVFHDSFKVTDTTKIRMSIGVVSTQAITTKSEVELTTMEGGKVISGRFVIAPKEFERAWGGLFIWMSEKGYNMADRNPFEIYHNNFNEHPEKKCIADLCIPIR